MRRFLSFGLAAVMVMSMTACGSNTTAETTTAASSQAGNETTATQAAASNEGNETFVIGALGPLTGGAASYGISVKQGSEIAINEINSAGGVKVGDKTYDLKLNFLDDEASEGTAVTAYNSLQDQGINALLGCVTSGASLAVVDQTAIDGILQISPSGSAQAITENDNVFRLCFTDPLQGETMADFVANKGYEKVAVLYNNADEYSTGIYDAFKVKLNELKPGILVSEEAFTSDTVDFATQLTSIKKSEADVIFVPGYYEAAAYITKQAKDAGIEAAFIGSDGWDGVLAQVTDKSVVEGAVFLSPFLATDPEVADFVSAYETAYKATPDQFAADGYDTVYVIKAAMEQAGSIESADLIAAMTKIQVKGLTGEVTFDVTGEPNKGAKFVQIKDGQYTPYEE